MSSQTSNDPRTNKKLLPSGNFTEHGSSQILAHVEQYRGPIPSPEALKAYEDVLPGLAERLVAYAEKEQSYRQEASLRQFSIDEKQLELDSAINEDFSKEIKRGQLIGFLVYLLSMGVGLLVFILGGTWEVIIAYLALPSVSLIIAFFTQVLKAPWEY